MSGRKGVSQCQGVVLAAEKWSEFIFICRLVLTVGFLLERQRSASSTGTQTAYWTLKGTQTHQSFQIFPCLLPPLPVPSTLLLILLSALLSDRNKCLSLLLQSVSQWHLTNSVTNYHHIYPSVSEWWYPHQWLLLNRNCQICTPTVPQCKPTRPFRSCSNDLLNASLFLDIVLSGQGKLKSTVLLNQWIFFGSSNKSRTKRSAAPELQAWWQEASSVMMETNRWAPVWCVAF